MMSELSLSKLGGRPYANPYVLVENSLSTGSSASLNGGYIMGRTGNIQPRGKVVKPSESGFHFIRQYNQTGYTAGTDNTLEGINASGGCLFHVQEDTNYGQVTINGNLSNDILLFCPYLGSSATITVPVEIRNSSNQKIIEGDMTVVAVYGVDKIVGEETYNQLKELFPNDNITVVGSNSLALTGKCVYAYLTNATYYSGYKDSSTNFALIAYYFENCGPALESTSKLDRYDGIDPPYEYVTS